MKESTRKRKESLMLKAASRIIQKKGLTNFTMEEVAEEAYVTKVTLYTYFISKENLTMAVCFSIYEELIDRLNEIESAFKDQKGLDRCLRVESEILNFISERPFRAIIILEFLALYNLPENKLSSAMANSTFRVKLNDATQKVARSITTYVEEGKVDGSIPNKSETDNLFFYIWNCISGFITLASTPFFQEEGATVKLKSLANFHENSARQILSR